MSPKSKNELGKLIRERREAVGLSLRDLEERSGVTYSYIAKIEQGKTEAPSADTLLRLGRAIEVEVEDLYALAGYVMPEGLPNFRPYLRAKYPDLSQKEVRELERYFRKLHEDDGGS